MTSEKILNLVFLPATAPEDSEFGSVPTRIETHHSVSIHSVRFHTMVWYNETVRRDAIAQIVSMDIAPIVLVGFSKSGLGAWNIARAIPDRVAGTIIFDAPVARDELPQWGTGPFYGDDLSWQKDLPIRTIREFSAAVPKKHSLVLVSGRSFHKEMMALSQGLSLAAVEHTFLPRPDMRHHWNSGWIEQGLDAIQKHD